MIEYCRLNIEYLRPARLALLSAMSSGRMTARMAGVVFFRFLKGMDSNFIKELCDYPVSSSN